MSTDVLDVMHTTFITTNQAAKFFPSAHSPGKCIGKQALYRWINRGVEIEGKMVKLQARKLGGCLFTTAQWVNEFIAKAATNPAVPKNALHPDAPGQKKLFEEAEQDLAKAGI